MSVFITAEYDNLPHTHPSAKAFLMEIGFLPGGNEGDPIAIYLHSMPPQMTEIKGYLGKCHFDLSMVSKHGLTVYYVVPELPEDDPRHASAYYGDGEFFIPFSNIAAISNRAHRAK